MNGTLVGLILAGVILAVHPQGLWLVLTLMLLQFIIEMTVTRNYALAVVFITAAALTIASGGHPVPDVGHVLWVRGVDTFIGCMTGLAILAMTTLRTVVERIPQELVNALAALTTTLGHAAEGEVTTGAARRARRDLHITSLPCSRPTMSASAPRCGIAMLPSGHGPRSSRRSGLATACCPPAGRWSLRERTPPLKWLARCSAPTARGRPDKRWQRYPMPFMQERSPRRFPICQNF
ncbi:FUSC family protein [Paralcaligenes sp. KSB-10]|nr:FUSC family protein [Paralcaligenes sp. KSB-10]